MIISTATTMTVTTSTGREVVRHDRDSVHETSNTKTEATTTSDRDHHAPATTTANHAEKEAMEEATEVHRDHEVRPETRTATTTAVEDKTSDKDHHHVAHMAIDAQMTTKTPAHKYVVSL